MSFEEQVDIQLFNQRFEVCRDDDQFFLVDASDADNIIHRLLFNISDNSISMWYGLRDIRLDWETDMMNQLLGRREQSIPIRVSAVSSKIKERCISSFSSQFVWTSVELFDENMVCELPNTNEKGAGFVGGSLLMISDGGVPCIERGKSSTFTMERCNELPNANYNTSDYCTAVIIPCGDVLEREYSLTAFYENTNIYLFDLKSDKFLNTPIKFNRPDDSFAFKGPWRVNAQIVPYLEGNRLRVFICQQERLFELVWSGEEFKSDLKAIRHLEWVQSVQSVSIMENIGLLVMSKDINRQVQSHIYEPQPYNSEHSKYEGIWRLVANINQPYVRYLYAPKSKGLIKRNRHQYSKDLTLEEIFNLPCNRVKEVFNEESHKRFKEYDNSFKTYVPKLETKAIEKVTINNPNKRINQAYQPKIEYLDHVEIIAGIKCKDYSEKLGQFISKDYVEILPEDCADYLGAPVLYQQNLFFENLECGRFILDMEYSQRSTKILETAYLNQHGGMGSGKLDLTRVCFIGILGCKPMDDSMEDEQDEQEELEYQQLFRQKEFRVESQSIIVSDPFILDGGVLIENVKPGIYKWSITNKTRDYCDGGRIDTTLTAQTIAVHSDYEKLLSQSNIWNIPDDLKEKYSECQRNEYFSDELKGGWFQMKHGVSSDGFVGIFDLKYFNEEKVLAGKVRPTCELEKHFKISHLSPWQEYHTNRMENENFPDRMDAPYGIITASGYGDGYYNCFFKKSEEGEVIAVKIFFA